MRLFITLFVLTIALTASAQRNQKKLETSFDFGAGNHFGLRQIENGFNVNALTLSNYTLGWNNYFTNDKIGGRLELSYDRMINNTNSASFQTNYFRATYFLNASLKHIVGWGISKKPIIDKKSFLQSFDIDLAAGIGYSGMTNKSASISESPFLRKADDMLNVAFKVTPSLEIASGLKLFASYTRINHSAQSNSFDFTRSLANTAFKGAFRTLNVGLRYTPQSTRVYSRTLKALHKNLHFITAIDASIGNHFAGSTKETTTKFSSLGINHLNVGATHKYPNSKLSGRFDLGYDIFQGLKNETEFKTKYFRTTYQVIADLGSLSPYQGNEDRFNLSFGMGFGFASMYNAQSRNNYSDKFLNGDDMYALVFSLMPSYKINNSLSLITNLTLVSHSLQSRSWDLNSSQYNSAFNGKLINFSLGMRYHLGERKWNYNAELENKINKLLTVDLAIGNHFGGRAQKINQSLSSTPGKHFAIGLVHPFHNPIYYGRFEMATDALNSANSTKANYFRSTYFLMSSIKNQLKRKDSFEEKNSNIDLHFGIGVGANMFKGESSDDTFLSKGDDVLNLSFRIAPTYKLSEKATAFLAYTFVSHSFQSMYYDMSQSIDKRMFNGRLMNASVGVAYTLRKSKGKKTFAQVIPVEEPLIKEVNKELDVVNEDTLNNQNETLPVENTAVSNQIIEENIIQKDEPKNASTESPSSVVNSTDEKPDNIQSRTSYTPVGAYPVNTAVITESQKQSLKDLAFQMKGNKFLSIQLTGHTDNIGSAEYNLVLSRKRAALVKEYLMSQGVSSDRIRIDYKGIANPIESNSTTEGRSKNRRVDIEIIKHTEPFGN
jgi:outer membrane protein OmpA-like peptidoglycan-associated protein